MDGLDILRFRITYPSLVKGHVNIKSKLIQKWFTETGSDFTLYFFHIKSKWPLSGHKLLQPDYQILVAPVTKSSYSGYQIAVLWLPNPTTPVIKSYYSSYKIQLGKPS